MSHYWTVLPKKGTGKFSPASSVREWLWFNSAHSEPALRQHNNRKKNMGTNLQMITASHAYLVTRSKNIKNGMFSVATPYFSKKGQCKGLSLNGCDCPIMQSLQLPCKMKANWSWSLSFRFRFPCLLWGCQGWEWHQIGSGKYRGGTFETCLSQ